MKNWGLRVLFRLTFLLSMVASSQAFASNRYLTYQGRITELNGTPLEYEFTQFKFEITNPAGTCVLYRETSNTIDMRNSQGVFDVAIGSGSVDPDTPAGNNIESVFKNDTTFNCIGGGTFAAANGNHRKLRVSFRDSVGWRLLTSDQEIRGVPFASFAQNAASANRLGTASETDFLKISNIPTCAAGTFLRHVAPTGTLICEGVGAISGGSISGNITGSAAGFTGSLAGDVTGTQSATSVDRVKGIPVNAGAAADGKVLKYSSGSLVFADDNEGTLTIADGSITDAKIASITSAGKVSGSAITSGIIGGSTAINTSGLIQTSNGVRLYSGSNFVELKAATTPSGDYTLRFPAAAGTNGQVLKTDASGNLYWANDDAGAGGGGTVTTVSSANSYITVANGTSTPTITAVVGTTANTLAAGDDSRFTDARTPTGSAGGDLTGTYPNPGVAAIRGNAVSTGTIPGADVGKVYRWNGTALTPAFLNFGDLRTAGGVQQLATVCAANEKIQWSVITDTFTCQAIGSLNASAITAGTIDAARLPASVKYWDAATGGINYAGGNVGINTLAPDAKFDVNGGAVIRAVGSNASEGMTILSNGSTAHQGGLYLSNSATFPTATSGYAYKVSSAYTNTQANSTLKIGLVEASAPNTFLSNELNLKNGRVGIETISPIARLHVGGDSDVVIDGATPYLITRSTTYPTDNTETAGIAYTSEANSASTTVWPPQANVSFHATQDHNATQKGTAVSIFTTPNNSTTRQLRMLVDQNGNVGIGTSTPSATLEVNGSFKSGNSWAKATPANTNITTSGTLGSFSFTCNGGPILIFGNLSVANTAGTWNSLVVYIREGSATGTVIRSVSGTSNNGPTVGLFSTTVQTLHNCSPGVKTFYLTLDTNAGVTVQALSIEFSAAELGLKSP